jgi:hypothetical protein
MLNMTTQVTAPPKTKNETFFERKAWKALLGVSLLIGFFGLTDMVLAFAQQVIWLSLVMILGVGSWLVITGLVARSTHRLPNSLLISLLAVPYLGFPVWAFWLGQNLLAW